MRLATNYDRIHTAGAEVVAVSVDDDVRQAGMRQRWGLTHTRFVADPGGAEILQPLGLYDPEERGGIALPAMLIYGPDGSEVYRYQGRDFADRTTDDDIYAALEALKLPAINPGPWDTNVAVPEDLKTVLSSPRLRCVLQGQTSLVRLPSEAGPSEAARPERWLENTV